MTLVNFEKDEMNKGQEVVNKLLFHLGYHVIPLTEDGKLQMTEQMRNFYSWGAKKFLMLKTATHYGLQFEAAHSRIRIYMNQQNVLCVEILPLVRMRLLKRIDNIQLNDINKIIDEQIALIRR